LFCPKCAYDYTKVSGVIKKEDMNERLRLCLNPECNYSFPTVELNRFSSYWKEYEKALRNNDNKDQKDGYCREYI